MEEGEVLAPLGCASGRVLDVQAPKNQCSRQDDEQGQGPVVLSTLAQKIAMWVAGRPL